MNIDIDVDVNTNCRCQEYVRNIWCYINYINIVTNHIKVNEIKKNIFIYKKKR